MSEHNTSTKLVAFGEYRFMDRFHNECRTVKITKDNTDFIDQLKEAGLHAIVKTLESSGTLTIKVKPD